MLKKISISVVAFSVLVLPVAVFARMTSANYTIYADSINTGGVYSSSTSYTLEDTSGEGAVGTSTGGIYEIRAGYQAMDLDTGETLDVTITTSSLDLGELSTSAVSTKSTIVSVTTDSATGYTMTISSATGAVLTPVASGQLVVAGVEAYGLSVFGDDSQVTGDKEIASGLTLASRSGTASAIQTTLTFKASISISSTPGAAYSQSVVLTVSANP